MVRSMENVNRERRLGMVAVQGGDVYWVPTVGQPGGPQFAGDGALVYQETSPDGKSREIKSVKVGALPRVLWRDHDVRWYSPTKPRRQAAGLARRQAAGVRERPQRLDHVYVMPLDATSESQATQLTAGNFGAGLGSWSPDSKRVAYHHSADGNQMERFVDVVDVATKRSEAIVRTRGVNLDPLFSPDGQVAGRAAHRSAELAGLYVAPVRAGATLTRLSDSMPAGLNRDEIVVPEPVSFPSRLDQAPVPGTIMLPRHLDKSKRHPAIVWIHGSGSDQNFLGWHPGSYRMYYSASVYLAQQGYVIITPDYRGSSGYSRDWSTGVHMGLGIKDSAMCSPAPTT